MEISKQQFLRAAAKAGLSDESKIIFWEALEAEETKNFLISRLLYYFGAMIVISAMTWFLNLAWTKLGGGWLFLISILYATAFFLVGKGLWKKEELKVPAGLLITVAVCMVPLAIYGAESYFGMFPQTSEYDYSSFYDSIKSSWIWMEIGTILTGIWALKFYPFPFLTAPIWFAAWFLSMDLLSLVIGESDSFRQKAWMTLFFGGVLLSMAYLLDRQGKSDYSFWGYLFGTIAFWGSLGILCFDRGEGVFFIYLLINVAMMIASILLNRKALMIFGAIGTFLYFAHLAYDVFEDSILFPFSLTFLGLMTIYLGVLYQKNSHSIEIKISDMFGRFSKNGGANDAK